MGSVGFRMLMFPSVLCGLLLLPSSGSLIDDDALALQAIKKAILEDPLSVLSDWNMNDNDKDPCGWSAVVCSTARDRVLTLNLSHSSLRGFLAPEIGSLKSLQQLILNDNLFFGTIPSQIGMLKNLTLLDLSTNRLVGPIPAEIGGLDSVTKINFHSNGLTGTVPPELGNLANLMELRLDRNKLQGSIPGTSNLNSTSDMHDMAGSVPNATGLCLLQQLKIADFSYNFLVGEVPPCLHYLPRTNFQGNCLQDKDSILQRATQQCGGTHLVKEEHRASNATRRSAKGGFKHQKPQQPTWLLILEIFTGVVVVVFIITAAYTTLSKLRPKSLGVISRKRSIGSRDPIVMSIDGGMLKHVLRLSRQELEIACEDFSNIIGSSSDSVVYKGTMKGGSEIAVISLSISEDHWTSHHEVYFENEVAGLARVNHDNTAKLLGYCVENEPFTRMLIFEYASNGTLYEHLHYGEGCQLTWTRRMKIAIGIARGLRYLHNELLPPFTLSELNSSSIYLTEDFSPKLVDFENWNSIFSRSERNSGYINGGAFHCFPDSLDRRHTNVQGNIFAFGVILLEIISGRPPYCKERGSLVDWALGFIDRPDTMCHLVDPELRYFKHDDLRIVCSVVSLCVQSEPLKRPSMQILCGMLENGIDTSAAADLKESPLAWAELALSS